VEQLGTQMGDVVECLRQFVEQGISVDKSVKTIIENTESKLSSFLQDKNLSDEHCAVAHVTLTLLETFEEVSQETIKKDYFPKKFELKSSLDYLVEKNILSYVVIPKSMKLHARRIRYAYENVKNEVGVKDKCDEIFKKHCDWNLPLQKSQSPQEFQ